MRRSFAVLVMIGCAHLAPGPVIPPGPPCGTGQRVFVLGAVIRPSSVPCDSARPMTVVGALAAARGFTVIARRDFVRIKRANRSYLIRVQAILDGLHRDVELSPDDTVIVQARD